MDEEMVTLDANVTWELVALPKDKKAIALVENLGFTTGVYD